MCEIGHEFFFTNCSGQNYIGTFYDIFSCILYKLLFQVKWELGS